MSGGLYLSLLNLALKDTLTLFELSSQKYCLLYEPKVFGLLVESAQRAFLKLITYNRVWPKPCLPPPALRGANRRLGLC